MDSLTTTRTYSDTSSQVQRNRHRHPIAKIKGGWTEEEDALLLRLVQKMGEGNWSPISRALNEVTGKNESNGRIGKQCRERYNHHLRPDIRKEPWTAEEEDALVEAHKRLGNRWSDIARCLNGRSENAVKNFFHAALRKRNADTTSPGPLKQYLDDLAMASPSRRRAAKRKRGAGTRPAVARLVPAPTMQAPQAPQANGCEAHQHAAGRHDTTISNAWPSAAAACEDVHEAVAETDAPMHGGLSCDASVADFDPAHAPMRMCMLGMLPAVGSSNCLLALAHSGSMPSAPAAATAAAAHCVLGARPSMRAAARVSIQRMQNMLHGEDACQDGAEAEGAEEHSGSDHQASGYSSSDADEYVPSGEETEGHKGEDGGGACCYVSEEDSGRVTKASMYDIINQSATAAATATASFMAGGRRPQSKSMHMGDDACLLAQQQHPTTMQITTEGPMPANQLGAMDAPPAAALTHGSVAHGTGADSAAACLAVAAAVAEDPEAPVAWAAAAAAALGSGSDVSEVGLSLFGVLSDGEDDACGDEEGVCTQPMTAHGSSVALASSRQPQMTHGSGGMGRVESHASLSAASGFHAMPAMWRQESFSAAAPAPPAAPAAMFSPVHMAGTQACDQALTHGSAAVMSPAGLPSHAQASATANSTAPCSGMWQQPGLQQHGAAATAPQGMQAACYCQPPACYSHLKDFCYPTELIPSPFMPYWYGNGLALSHGTADGMAWQGMPMQGYAWPGQGAMQQYAGMTGMQYGVPRDTCGTAYAGAMPGCMYGPPMGQCLSMPQHTCAVQNVRIHGMAGMGPWVSPRSSSSGQAVSHSMPPPYMHSPMAHNLDGCVHGSTPASPACTAKAENAHAASMQMQGMQPSRLPRSPSALTLALAIKAEPSSCIMQPLGHCQLAVATHTPHTAGGNAAAGVVVSASTPAGAAAVGVAAAGGEGGAPAGPEAEVEADASMLIPACLNALPGAEVTVEQLGTSGRVGMHHAASGTALVSWGQAAEAEALTGCNVLREFADADEACKCEDDNDSLVTGPLPAAAAAGAGAPGACMAPDEAAWMRPWSPDVCLMDPSMRMGMGIGMEGDHPSCLWA